MAEAASPLVSAVSGNWFDVVRLYGGSVLLALAAIPAGVVVCLRQQSMELCVLAVFSVVGAILLLLQIRLHYFGVGVVLLFFFYVCDHGRSRVLWSSVLGVVLVGMLAGVPVLLARPALADNPDYAVILPIYRHVGEICDESPGVVLADQNDGHPIRFHSACSVMANNFILTPQHEEKIREVNQLMAGTFDELRSNHPYIEYVLVRRVDSVGGVSVDEAKLRSRCALTSSLVSKVASLYQRSRAPQCAQ